VGSALGVIVVHKYLEGMMCFSATEVWDHSESMMCFSGTEAWDHKRKNTLRGTFFSTCNK